MKIRYQHVIAIVAGGIMVGGFQNCAQTNFGSPPGTMLKASVNGDGTDGSGDASGNLVQDGNTCTMDPDAPTTTSSSYRHSSTAKISCHQPDGTPNECAEDASSDLVACILNGPGKSLKLGLVNGALAGVNGVSSSVCISKSECLGDVAKSFGVTGAYQRGYCDGNPNVTSLSDAQVKALLGI